MSEIISDNTVNNSANDASRRLFLACWPDQPLQQLLYDLARRIQMKHGGRRIEKENIHLTLMFLGQVHKQKENEIRERLRLIDVKEFNLELDQTGSFTSSRINWVGPSIVPKGLKELQTLLKHINHELGFHKDEKSFQPHVTLLRETENESAHAIKKISWDIDKYCLIESITSRGAVEYSILEEFPLMKKTNTNAVH